LEKYCVQGIEREQCNEGDGILKQRPRSLWF